MSWIRVDQLMPSHPKAAALAEVLHVSRHEAIGLLVEVWCYASMYHINGNLTGAVKAHFDKYLDGFDSVKLTDALRATNLLDADGMLHDWSYYAGVEIGRRIKHAKYMQEYRLTKPDKRKASRKASRSTSRDIATDVRTYERKERAREDANTARATAPDGPRAGVRLDPAGVRLDPNRNGKPTSIAETMAALRAKLKPADPEPPTTNGSEPHA